LPRGYRIPSSAKEYIGKVSMESSQLDLSVQGGNDSVLRNACNNIIALIKEQKGEGVNKGFSSNDSVHHSRH
jgi:hypothetical protein